MVQASLSPSWWWILGVSPIVVDVWLLLLCMKTILEVAHQPSDRWSKRSSQSKLIFGTVVAFSMSTLVFTAIKITNDVRNFIVAEVVEDSMFILFNAVLMVAYLFTNYLMLCAMYTRLSILYKSNCHKQLFVIGLMVLLVVTGVIGAGPTFGPSLFVQQLCVVLVLIPIVLCTVILFAASTKRISPSILTVDDTDFSRPSAASKSLGPQQRQSFHKNHMNLMLSSMDRGAGHGRTAKLKASTKDSVDDNLSANMRSLKRREQDLLRKFVNQQQKTVVVIVLTLALQILLAGITARYDSLMTNRWTVTITSFVLSLNSGITLRSITSTHRQKQCRRTMWARTCQWLRTASPRKNELNDDTRYVKRGDGQREEDGGDSPSGSGEQSQVEMEGIQIHRTGCHQTNKNPKLLLDDEMRDKIPYFDACVFPDTAMSYQSHGDPVSIEMPSFEDSPPPVPSRIIPSFGGSIDIVESALSLSSEGTTFNYEY